MPLESTMICLDNSDYMRNGDYLPTRLEAQQDAAGIVCNDRINSNPENTVGILTMAGQGVDLLVSPTEESGKILASFAHIKIGGSNEFTTAIQIAQLALKHRKNKNAAQRVIAFVGSPVTESLESLQRLGKQLKKNNVAVDVISIGETNENTEKLQEFVNSANSGDNSHLITVPSGVSPANAIMSSSILYSSAGGRGGQMGFDEGGGDMYEMDPEMAMALRVSAEEDRARQEAMLKASEDQGTSEGQGQINPSDFGIGEEEDEEALMQRALELSLREASNSNMQETSSTEHTDNAEQPMETVEEEDDEEMALQRALALSMNENNQDDAPTTATTTQNFTDPEFVRQMLGASDVNDPLVQAALAQLQEEEKEKQEEKESKKRRNDER